MVINQIKTYLQNFEDKPNIIKIGYIKEFLQTKILKQIYEFEDSKNLIFYGGTSLRFLFGLNRLSEDLDFVGKDFKDFKILAIFLQKYFKNFGLEVDYKIQKFRITLKFRDFLKNFNLNFGNSNDLYIKIEISDYFDFCENYKTKIYPIFKNNEALLIKSFDKNTLFSTKLNAVLNRKWEKQVGINKISVKGRDIYDLFWYLSNDFKPNYDCIIGVKNKQDLQEKLEKIIENINFKEVILDIKNFLEDENLLNFLEKEGKSIILEKIDNL